MIPKKLLNDLKRISFQKQPHIIILGAGASIATSSNEDYIDNKLPSMNDLPDVLELKKILDKDEYLYAKKDFEGFYDELVKRKNIDLQIELEKKTEDYFGSINIQSTVTLYDKLVLSLRPKDTIFSFNWDPLLPYAYRRNGFLNTLPALWFLHGNVLNGFCDKCKRIGWSDDHCTDCGSKLKRAPLLYPIKNKDYNKDPVISEAWKHLDHEIKAAYFLTIFGYSAPKTDVVARERIVKNLSKNITSSTMQIEIIDINYDLLLNTTYKELKEYYKFKTDNFDYCWLMSHPKLSCEALFEATMQNSPIYPYPQIKTNDLTELQEWSKELDNKIPNILEEKRIWQG